jgi:hypothetical protein
MCKQNVDVYRIVFSLMMQCANRACGGYNTRKVGAAKDDHPPDPSPTAAAAATSPAAAAAPTGDAVERFVALLNDLIGADAATAAMARIQGRPELLEMMQVPGAQGTLETCDMAWTMLSDYLFFAPVRARSPFAPYPPQCAAGACTAGAACRSCESASRGAGLAGVCVVWGGP